MYHNILFVAKLLAAVGALNWGLVGLFEFNLVTFLFGEMPLSILTRIIYVLVGASGVVLLTNLVNKAPKTIV